MKENFVSSSKAKVHFHDGSIAHRGSGRRNRDASIV